MPCQLTPKRDCEWEEFIAAGKPAPCVPVSATDPLYILYTSGTTGKPKGIMRDNGGHAVALKWTMRNIYDTAPAKSIGRLPTSVGLSGTLTSFMRRFSTVTRRYYTKENGGHAGCRRFLVGLSPNTCE